MVWFGLRQRVESTSSSTLPTRPYLPTHLAYLLPQGIHLRAPCPSPQHPLALLPTPSTEPVPDQLAGRWSSSPVSSLAYPCSQKELNSTGVSLGPASDDYRSKLAHSEATCTCTLPFHLQRGHQKVDLPKPSFLLFALRLHLPKTNLPSSNTSRILLRREREAQTKTFLHDHPHRQQFNPSFDARDLCISSKPAHTAALPCTCSTVPRHPILRVTPNFNLVSNVELVLDSNNHCHPLQVLFPLRRMHFSSKPANLY